LESSHPLRRSWAAGNLRQNSAPEKRARWPGRGNATTRADSYNQMRQCWLARPGGLSQNCCEPSTAQLRVSGGGRRPPPKRQARGESGLGEAAGRGFGGEPEARGPGPLARPDGSIKRPSPRISSAPRGSDRRPEWLSDP
jgi:hypothetical protein